MMLQWAPGAVAFILCSTICYTFQYVVYTCNTSNNSNNSSRNNNM